jgi:hypothetical protein
MGRFAIAVSVACLASSSIAIAQENKSDARQQARVVQREGSPAQPSSEAVNASVVRVAMRGAFASEDQPRLTRQEALGLLLVLSSAQHNK